MEPTSTSLVMGGILGSVRVGLRTPECIRPTTMTESRISSRSPSRQITQPAQLCALALPRGELEEEPPAERPQGPLDAHAVFEDAPQNQVADLVVILGLG